MDNSAKTITKLGLPEQVLTTEVVFRLIAECTSVSDLVSLAHTNHALHRAVVSGLDDWKCRHAEDQDSCGRSIFHVQGTPSSCQECRTLLCADCTDRCQTCNEIGCWNCELFLCDRCQSWNHLDCKYRGPYCSECDVGYCETCSQTVCSRCLFHDPAKFLICKECFTGHCKGCVPADFVFQSCANMNCMKGACGDCLNKGQVLRASGCCSQDCESSLLAEQEAHEKNWEWIGQED